MATKITTALIDAGAITSALITDASITADDLHTTLDLTGKTVTVATATAGDNDTSVASTAFVATAIANLADSAPETLNTLNELAAALGDDANFSTTVTNSIATKAPLASPTFTGTITGTLATAAQPNITSVGSLTALTGGTGDLNWDSGTLFVDSSANSVGIGTTSPNSDTTLTISAANNQIDLISTDNSQASINFVNSGGISRQGFIKYVHDGDFSGNMQFRVAGSERLRIDSSGNVGIGITPSAWQVNNRAIQFLDGYGSISSNNSQGCCDVSSNTYNAGSAATSGWKYKNTGASSLYQQHAGQHKWFTAASGSADATISWAERMRIESSGQILITNETPSIKFVDSGDNSAQFIQAYGGYLRYYADDNNILSGSEHSWWVDGTRKMTLDSSGNLDLGGSLAVDSNATLIDTTVTGGNFVPGCAADTFHEITNIDWNGYFTDNKYAYFIVRLFWTSGVVDAGYNHRVTIMSPNHSSNATPAYAGVGSYTTSHTGYGTGDGRLTPLIMASHHTGVIAIDQFKIDVKFDNVTDSNGPLYMHVKTNRPPLASTAAVKIQVWRF